MIRIRDITFSTTEQTVVGWVEKISSFKKFSFLILRDGLLKSDHLQVVVSGSLDPQVTQESYVEIAGSMKKLPDDKFSYHPFELHASSIKILSSSTSDYSSRCPPDAGVETKLEQRHLYLREPEFAMITLLRAKLLSSLRRSFEDMGCTEIVPRVSSVLNAKEAQLFSN